MKNQRRYYQNIYSLLFLSFSAIWSLQAQPEFFFEGPYTAPAIDDIFEIRLRATGFEEMQSVQFSLNWDAEKAEYVGVVSTFPTDEVDYNELNTATGIFGVVWADIETYSLPDTANLMVFTFKALQDGAVNLSISNDPVNALVAYKENGQTFEESINVVNFGDITVGMETSTANGLSSGTFQPASPNPFTDFTYIPITLTQPETVSVTIWGVDGKKINQHSKRYGAGNHHVKIHSEDLPAIGTYWCRLETSATSITTQLILVK